MNIKKSSLTYFTLWLSIIFLLGLNVGVYTSYSAQQKIYRTKIADFEIEKKRLLREQEHQLSFYHEVYKKIEPFTPEEQEKIDFINNGYVISRSADDSVPKDCSMYEKPWRKSTGGDCGFVLKHSAGQMNLLIIEFASPRFDTGFEGNSKLLEVLHDEKDLVDVDGIPNSSYQYLSTYFEAQAKIFGANDFSLNVDFTNIIPLSNFPLYKGLTRNEQLKEKSMSTSFFLNELSKAQIDIRDYDAIAVVVFVDNEDPDFVSFAIPDLRANVNRISGGYDFTTSDSAVSLIAHETAHLLGASDQYIEGESGCQEEKVDTYVTNGAQWNLMCQLSSLIPFGEYSAQFNARTVREFGWLR